MASQVRSEQRDNNRSSIPAQPRWVPRGSNSITADVNPPPPNGNANGSAEGESRQQRGGRGGNGGRPNHVLVPGESRQRRGGYNGNAGQINQEGSWQQRRGENNGNGGQPNHGFTPSDGRQYRGGNNGTVEQSNHSSEFPESRHRRGGHNRSGGQSNTNSTLSENRQQRGGCHGSRGSAVRTVYHRREKEKSESQEGMGMKDSNLPQLVQEIQDKLTKGTVECMICYDMVRRSAPVWSCSSCYSIFHLSCIKKWARAPTSIDMSAGKNQGDNWRCPGCQFVQLTSSKEIQYVCFCGKRTDPPSDLYLTPHSCGEHCGKPLEKEVPGSGTSKDDLCPHMCVLQCHPGPCPPCKAFAPPRLCPCGKKTITTRCSDRSSVLTCGDQCGKLLDCGRHRCDRKCHVGPCDPCQLPLNASCFCQKTVEVVLCGEMIVKGEVKAEDGVFSCSSNCGRKLSCGNHDCSEICHPGPCGQCSLMPQNVKACHCGKTSLQEERLSCLDPIPTCSQICEKTLPCEVHRCQQVCHAGDCPPCLVEVNQKCRCGSTSRNIECCNATSAYHRFTCDKPCGRKKSCGRHRCSERCCPLASSNDRLFGEWYPHLCSMPCGKKLRCGQHSCESLCHSGHCPPCLHTIFNDLTCACGRTSIPPPLPCGTPPPSCQLPCSVPQPCGHSASHSCHFGDCPPCSVPVPKECIGGHVVFRNIPCGSKDIKCNKPCGKMRQCGIHACSKTCHPPPCESSLSAEAGSKSSCGQICGAPRRDCRHTCTAPCHPYAACPDARCDFPVTITCSCGRITANVPCHCGGSTNGSGSGSVFEASVIQKLPVPLQPVEATNTKVPLGQRKLMCDDECTKLERKRALADAFDIAPPNLDGLHIGESNITSELLSDIFRRDPKWVISVEERCKQLVLGKSKGATSSLRVHVFCPMLKEKRDVVRVIADRWKLAVQAAGWEPKRFIVVHATPKSKMPARVLGIKGATTVNTSQAPAFDQLVDMDPRLVVSFPDLPRDADISALVLRFGGECELVWLNDKNALAVFNDPARAATALRRLDNGTLYHGAIGAPSVASSGSNGWGGGGIAKEGAYTSLKANAWKKAVIRESSWIEDSWGDEELSGESADLQASVWKKEAPIAAQSNRWSILDNEVAQGSSSVSPTVGDSGKHIAAGVSPTVEDSGKPTVGSSISVVESNASCSTSSNPGSSTSAVQPGGSFAETSEVADDWEKAYE